MCVHVSCLAEGEELDKVSQPVALHYLQLQKKLIRSEALPPSSPALFRYGNDFRGFFCPSGSALMTPVLLFSSSKGNREVESPHLILQAPTHLMRRCFDHQGLRVDFVLHLCPAGVRDEHYPLLFISPLEAKDTFRTKITNQILNLTFLYTFLIVCIHDALGMEDFKDVQEAKDGEDATSYI